MAKVKCKPKIICHGGAGKRRGNWRKAVEAVDRAAREGYKVLKRGGSALDAVTRAVSVMEDDPNLNAGTGSYIQLDGIARMDACIMDSDLNVGAVIQIDDVKNPIQVARKVLETSVHSVLMGDLASDFARQQGFPIYDPRTDERLALWLRIRKKFAKYQLCDLMVHLREEAEKREKLSTVGAVAIDRDGRLAAGTSTGGLRIDLPGRVGDVPLVGCGNYACKHGAVSCTGIGEKIIKVVLAKSACDFMARGMTAKEACVEAIKLVDSVRGQAGLIAIDARGNVGWARNAPFMSVKVIGDD
ncbi:MAG TPA: asparaginase [Proteobacteria bacterium]|nr:asparaginase [Pseudomonadota bacterium]